MQLPELLNIINIAHINVAHAQETAKAAAQPSVVAIFGLDWKLFLAQLVNFGIVLFVLWKWVFTPVAKGLASRTEKIEKSLQDAQQIAADKETFESWKNAEMGKVRTEAAGIITEAKQQGEQLRKQLTEQTKQEQEKIIQQTQAKLEMEQQKAIQEVKGEIAGMVIMATQTILKQKLDDKKDQELIKDALQKAKV